MLNTKLLSLMKYANVTISELKPEIINDILSALGQDELVAPDDLSGIIEVLRADDVDKLADMLQRPDVLPKIMPHLVKKDDDMNMIICPHCDGFVAL